MQALNELPTSEAIPYTIDYDLDPTDVATEESNWFVAPFYEGDFLTFDDETPHQIIETLARIHVHFAPQAAQIDWLYQVDPLFFRRTFDNALEILRQAQAEKPNRIYADAFQTSPISQ